jgi:UDP:flavonoid glycosyltransferase YjiC (YdhE family)
MATVLIAWELGGGLHHVMRARALAEAFTAKGYAVTVALRDLSLRHLVAWPPSTRVLQAPHAIRVRLVDRPSTYADILYMNGWHASGPLSGLVAGWGALMELIEPVAVVADHAPTACLVARLGEIPLVRMGTGFFAPPATQPLPSFRLQDAASPQRMQVVEEAVLANANVVAKACGIQYASVAEAVAPGLDLITCWPELDHYAGVRPPGPARFVGLEHVHTPSSPVQWPDNGRPRVLAYLSAEHPAIGPLLQSLALSDAATVAHVGGPGADSVSPPEGGGLVLRPELFDPGPALTQCDVLVCHAANGMTGAALAAGKPVLMWPMTAEQQLFARRVEALDVGAVLPLAPTAAELTARMHRAIDPSPMAARARALAARHAHEPDGLTCAVQATLDWLSGAPGV